MNAKQMDCIHPLMNLPLNALAERRVRRRTRKQDIEFRQSAHIFSGEVLTMIRRGGRAVECAGLENRNAARHRGFESHPLRRMRTQFASRAEGARTLNLKKRIFS